MTKLSNSKKSKRLDLKQILTVASISMFMAGSAAAETLAQALTSAYNHSGLLEQNRAVLRAADEDVAIAMASLRPTLDWSAEVVRSFGYQKTSTFTGNFAKTESTVALIAGYTLYDFGRNKLNIEAAKETVLATRETLISVEQQILFQAVSAFWEVRRALEIVGLRQSNVRVIQTELKAARDRFEVGEVTRTDVALAEARLASARSALATSQGDLEIARAQYTAVIGHKPGNLTPPRSLPRLPGQKEGGAMALRQHPDMRTLQHQISAWELRLEAAKRETRPTIDLSGRLAATDNLDNGQYTRSGTITLGARGPIYQGGRLSAQTRKVQAQRDGARGNLHSVRHEVTQNVAESYARLTVAAANIEASERQVRASRVAFRGVREEASLGARTTFDVLQAEQELLDAQSGLLTAKIDQHVASYRALSALGMLTAAHLKLDVLSYDAAEYYNLVKTAPTPKSRQGRALDRVLERLQNE